MRSDSEVRIRVRQARSVSLCAKREREQCASDFYRNALSVSLPTCFSMRDPFRGIVAATTNRVCCSRSDSNARLSSAMRPKRAMRGRIFPHLSSLFGLYLFFLTRLSLYFVLFATFSVSDLSRLSGVPQRTLPPSPH